MIKPYYRKANYYETDQMAIIHHSNYIRWFEEARTDFMDQIGFGYTKAISANIDFALLGVSCEYKSMVRFGDEVLIYCSVSQMGLSKMTISYRVLDAKSKELRATGETKHCYYHSLLQRPVSLKKYLPELFETFMTLKED